MNSLLGGVLRSSVALAALALLPGVGVSAAQGPQCVEGYSVTAGACSCNGNACTYTFTATSAPYGFVCGNCRWNYSWAVECYECGDPTASGTLDLKCDPHQRAAQNIGIPCPSGGGPWVTVAFTCSYCL